MEPNAYLAFWVSNLRELPDKPETLLWIPATASLRMPHIARFALPEATIITTDLCGTPIIAGQKIYGNDPQMQFSQADVFKLPPDLKSTLKGKTSAIVTDAFMTRFPPEGPESQRELYSLWKDILKPGGFILTSIRQPNPDNVIPGMPIEQNSRYTTNYVADSIEAYKKGLRLRSITRPPVLVDVIGNLAGQYLTHMGSSHARTRRDQELAARKPWIKAPPNVLDTKATLSEIGYRGVRITWTNQPSLDITPRHYNLVRAIK